MDKHEKRMPDKIGNFYTENFQRKVIEDYLLSGKSKDDISRKYGLKGHSCILQWMRALGYVDNSALKRVKFKFSTFMDVTKKKSVGDESGRSLEQQIVHLKKRLEDQQLQSELYLRMIEKAEKEYNIPIRKKSDTR
jgi:transposase